MFRGGQVAVGTVLSRLREVSAIGTRAMRPVRVCRASAGGASSFLTLTSIFGLRGRQVLLFNEPMCDPAVAGSAAGDGGVERLRSFPELLAVTVIGRCQVGLLDSSARNLAGTPVQHLAARLPDDGSSGRGSPDHGDGDAGCSTGAGARA